MSHKIIQGDNVATLKTFEDNSIDSIVTDPPYGIEFLGKDWDKNTGAVETWQECLRVLKPGGYLLAFSAARTYHHLATNIESVGFEIRDQLMWLYASGFPKAQDIGKAIDRRITKQKTDIRAEYNGGKHGTKNVDLGMQGVRCPKCKRDSNARYDCKEQDCGMIYKAQTPEAQQWSGWKTALKPAHEPIVMARKPFKGSTIDNVLTHGVGALNIDESRVANSKLPPAQKNGGSNIENFDVYKAKKDSEYTPNEQGRFPANVLGEVEGYQKYFYCPKVSRRERHCGFEQVPDPLENYSQGDVKNHPLWDPSIGTNLQRLKHKIMEHNRDLGPKDPLAHIPTNPEGMWDDGVQFQERKQLSDSAPQGQRRCSKDSYERWQQSIEYRKGGKPDPLAHIPAPFGDVKGAYQDSERFAAKHQSLQKDNIMSAEDMVKAMGGKLITNNRVWTPDLGEFYIHGLKEEYIKWCEKNNKATGSMGNNHPTVKPVALMRWLINLVTPKNSKVLDPFCGSGSTGMAAVELGHEFVGCELDPNYVAIANRRIAGWNKPKETDNTYNEIFEEK